VHQARAPRRFRVVRLALRSSTNLRPNAKPSTNNMRSMIPRGTKYSLPDTPMRWPACQEWSANFVYLLDRFVMIAPVKLRCQRDSSINFKRYQLQRNLDPSYVGKLPVCERVRSHGGPTTELYRRRGYR
jgi:hypothetical protein